MLVLSLMMAMVAQKDSGVLMPFMKPDVISSSRVLIHYKCVSKWEKSTSYVPVYVGSEMVGAGILSHVGKDGWAYAKIYFKSEVNQDCDLRANLKVHGCIFKQDGCYWQIEDASITKFVLVKNGTKFD